MSTHLEILNDSGTIQITDQFKNFSFVRKGYCNAGTMITIGSNELIAIRADNDNWCTFFDPNSKACFCTLSQDGLSKYCYLYGSGTIYYYIFSFSNPGGDCFEVRNANNNVVFSDAVEYMKVLWQVSGYDTNMTSRDTIYPSTIGRTLATVSYSNHGKFAIIPSSTAFVWQIIPHGTWMTCDSFVYSTNGDTTTCTCIYKKVLGSYDPSINEFYGVSPNIWMYSSVVSFLVVDVTNL